jgi:hypothetical protein
MWDSKNRKAPGPFPGAFAGRIFGPVLLTHMAGSAQGGQEQAAHSVIASITDAREPAIGAATNFAAIY